MTKPFFEVFPTLKIDGPLHDRLEQASVERVSASRKRDLLHVYLFSARLIQKEDIWKAEEEIRRQFFQNAAVSVKIHERFELSAQYTPENLMDVYGESILEELKAYSHIEYNAFRTAQISYPEQGRMTLTIEDNVMNRSKEPELVRVLEKILVERCGMQCTVDVGYREAKEGKFAEDDARKLELKVAEIAKRVQRNGEDESPALNGGADRTETAARSGESERGKAVRGMQSEGGSADGAGQKGQSAGRGQQAAPGPAAVLPAASFERAAANSEGAGIIPKP